MYNKKKTAMRIERLLQRLAIIVPANLGPYHYARYRALGDICELHLVPAQIREHHRPWVTPDAPINFEIHHAPEDSRASQISRVNRVLADISPDAIILVGYGAVDLLVCTILQRIRSRKVPVLLLMDTAEIGRFPLFKKRLETLFDGIIASGRRAEYVASRLFPKTPVFIAGNPVDNAHFAAGRSSEREGFVSVSRLSPEKNSTTLVESYARYRAQGGIWKLRLFGSGPLEQHLRSMIQGIEGVSMHGWAAYEALPEIYGTSRASILASRYEPWGLVVNESLAAGAPVIMSKSCGAYPDLSATDSLVFDSRSETALADRMHRLSTLSMNEYISLQQIGYELVAEQSVSKWATRMHDAIVVTRRNMR